MGNLRAVLRRHIFCRGVANSLVRWLVSQKAAANIVSLENVTELKNCLGHGAITRRAAAQSWLSQLPQGTVFYRDMKRIMMNGSESGQQETMHNSRPIDALSANNPYSTQRPRSSMSDHPSITLSPRVSFEVDSEIHKAIQAQLFTVLCIFVAVQSSEATHAHCFFNMINAGSCKKEAGMREDTTSTSATSVAPIASSALALALAAGEHSEGSETASGASADLCVDSGKRYHMRQVSPQLEQGISSRMGAAESIINVNSTAARRVCEQSSGEWRKATREHEAGTHQHRTRCPGKMDVFHGCYDVGGPARAGDVARDHGVQIEPKTAARHEGPVAKMHVGLDDVRNASREVARRRDHDTVTDMDGAFASHVAQLRQHRSVPDSTLPTSAPTPPEVRQESARDTTVLTHIRKAHSAYDQFQRDAKSVVAKNHGVLHDARLHSRARPQNCSCQRGKARSRAHVVGNAGIER